MSHTTNQQGETARNSARRRVVIVQEYVPAYRVPLFEGLKSILADRGVDVAVAAGRPGPAAQRRGDSVPSAVDLPVPQVELRAFGKRLTLRWLRRATRNADLVILEQARRNLDAYPAMLGGKTALWGHGRHVVGDETARSRAHIEALTRRARWFFAYTPAGAEAVVAAGVPRDRVTVLFNSTDTRTLTRARAELSPADVSAVRRELGVSEPTAIFIGALEAPKRIEFLLKAAHAAHGIDDRFRLVIVGDGSERQAVEADTSGAIVYHPRATGGELARIASTAGAVAMPGLVGLVAVDALALGLPTVTTDWPWHGPERAYLDEKTSVVAANDPDKYARELVTLLQDAPRLAAMSAACTAAAHDFTVEAMALRFADGVLAALAAGDRRDARR